MYGSSRKRSRNIWFADCLLIAGQLDYYDFKSVSMRKPGRTRQVVMQLKSPILLKLGTNVGYGE